MAISLRDFSAAGDALVEFLAIALVVIGTGCSNGSTARFARLAEARAVAADLRFHFERAAATSNSAVMADTDEASVAYAREAESAKQLVVRDAAALATALRGAGLDDESKLLTAFGQHYAEYETIDHAVLELAVENTNLKAQKLSFGPAAEAGSALRDALEAVTRSSSPRNRAQAERLALTAVAAVREIQVLQAPHIAETQEAAMARLEGQMAQADEVARQALKALAGLDDAATAPHLAAANEALERFQQVNAQILVLSRKNTNVRSLALALGQKRIAADACDAQLAELLATLATHESKATR